MWTGIIYRRKFYCRAKELRKFRSFFVGKFVLSFSVIAISALKFVSILCIAKIFTFVLFS